MATLTALSPRISFSYEDSDLSLPAAAPRLDASIAIDDDFDFSVSLDAISVDDRLFSPADRLFSHGKLLPLSSLNSTPDPLVNKYSDTKNQEAQPSAPRTSSSSSTTRKPSLWNAGTIGRSSSVGAAASSKSKLSSVYPSFPRSKSTGSYYPKKVKNDRSNSTSYYSYSGIGGKRSGGVRISPVINVGPINLIPRGGSGSSSSASSGGGGRSVSSFFAYLLCNCRDKNGRELVCGGEI